MFADARAFHYSDVGADMGSLTDFNVLVDAHEGVDNHRGVDFSRRVDICEGLFHS